MSRKIALFYFTLINLFLFSLFLTASIRERRRVEVSLQEELLSQAISLRENLEFIAGRTNRNPQDLIAQFRRPDLKVNIQSEPAKEAEPKIKKFPNDDRDWLVLTLPVRLKNFEGQIEVARPFLLKSPPYFIYILIFFLISASSAFLFNFLIGKPFRELISSCKEGKEGLKRFFSAPDEISEFARLAFESEEKLKEVIERLKEEREALFAMLPLMEEPCFILDENRRILIANARFRALAAAPEQSSLFGVPLASLLINSRLERFIDLVVQNGVVTGFELALGEDFYSAAGRIFRYNHQAIRIICVLNKVTERKRWERMKREFVSAVAHEIKTPLTAIRGVVEMIRPKLRGGKKRFLASLERHTERLINIASDLLTLSRLEDAATSYGSEATVPLGGSEATEKSSPVLTITRLSLKKILVELKGLYATAAKRKKLKLKLFLPAGDITIKGDPYLLEQAFSNLLDNAIKYTESGEIEIRLSETAAWAVVAFSDTGIGIPKEDLERIFERFYVVDKSRSKKTAGAGLGLSIVKHIINLHKGRIEVKSELSKGSTFTVFLPKGNWGEEVPGSFLTKN